MDKYPFFLFSPIDNNRYKSIVNNIPLNLISQNLGNIWDILRLLVLLQIYREKEEKKGEEYVRRCFLFVKRLELVQ